MNTIRTEQQMADMKPIDQAKKAIAHILNKRHDNKQLAYWISPGSQSFSLLTEAAASLWGRPLEEIRGRFWGAEVENPDAWRLALQYIAAGDWRRDGVASVTEYAQRVLDGGNP